jgi:hypothetical protein
MTVKAQILEKLAEIEALLLEAECDGAQLAELDCYTDVQDAYNNLVGTVDYFVD